MGWIVGWCYVAKSWSEYDGDGGVSRLILVLGKVNSRSIELLTIVGVVLGC